MLSDFHFDLFSAVALKIIFNKAYMFLQEAELPQSACHGASASRNIRIPPWGEYGRMRLSKIKAAKQLEFSKSVSDKTIFKS